MPGTNLYIYFSRFPGCTSDWKKLETGWYAFSEISGSYYMAMRFCHRIGGYVVNVTSETEHFALVNEIGKFYSFFFLNKVRHSLGKHTECRRN